MALYPSSNDRDYDLLKKAAWNLYEYALANGATGLNSPSWNDRWFDLWKKCVYYSAAIPR